MTRSPTDPSPDIRLAGIRGRETLALRELINDVDPSVRAAALREFARHDPTAVDDPRWRTDPAPQVRLAVVQATRRSDVAAAFEADDDPVVATEALVAHVALAHDGPLLRDHLTQLANAPPASVERLRIALAWLLVLPP